MVYLGVVRWRDFRAILPNFAFDPGHGPVRAPSCHHHHSIVRSPLIARLGPCRSMLASGPTEAPVHEGAKNWPFGVGCSDRAVRVSII